MVSEDLEDIAQPRQQENLGLPKADQGNMSAKIVGWRRVEKEIEKKRRQKEKKTLKH